MGLSKSQNTGPSIPFHSVSWNESKKNPERNYPNASFQDESGSYQDFVSPDDRPGFEIRGKLINMGVSPAVGYNDRSAGKDEKNALKLWFVVEDHKGSRDGFSFPLINDRKQANRQTAYMLNQMGALLDSGRKDEFIEMSFYRHEYKLADGTQRSEGSCATRVSIGQDETGAPMFNRKDASTLVKADQLPPKRTALLDADGEPVIGDDGKPIMSSKELTSWTAALAQRLIQAHFSDEEHQEMAQQSSEAISNEPPVEDDEVDPDEGVNMAQVADTVAQHQTARMR